MNSNLSQIIRQYKDDQQSVYNTWFINNEDRLKAFRSIRSRSSLLKAAGIISQTKDLKAQREGFANLSANMLSLAKMVKLSAEPVYQQHRLNVKT
jgi:Protein of unknown function (DUF3347)